MGAVGAILVGLAVSTCSIRKDQVSPPGMGPGIDDKSQTPTGAVQSEDSTENSSVNGATPKGRVVVKREGKGVEVRHRVSNSD